jgi:hypothetical protein
LFAFVGLSRPQGKERRREGEEDAASKGCNNDVEGAVCRVVVCKVEWSLVLEE